ncbi:MAG: phospholipase D-like domain-containing protein [bacterium]|nr:phospholipase D-like domain-containing protein [bacterium]
MEGSERKPSRLATDVSDGRRRLHFVAGNALEFYDCGKRAFPAMLSALTGATRSISLEIYTLRSDRIGSQVIDILEERARAGVHVRLVYDAIGSIGLGSRRIASLLESGVEVGSFNPPWRGLSALRAVRRRDHRKLSIIDGEVAFLGGLNLGDEYDGFPSPDEGQPVWRDTHLRLRGPIVSELERAFEGSWRRTTSKPDRIRAAAKTLASGRSENDVMMGSAGRARVAVVADGRRRENRRTARLLARAIDASRESIRITSPYFAPSARIRRALRRAAARGVGVEILTAGETDHRILRWAHHATATPLLEAGVRLFEFAPAMMHAKCSVFDERLAIVGSSNLDRQSLLHSFELNVVIDDEPAAREIRSLIGRDLDHSHEITIADLQRRTRWRRVRDLVAARFVAALL